MDKESSVVKLTPNHNKRGAPEHLRAQTREWFEFVLATYALEPHHFRLLQMAAESWDRGEQAREALAKSGLTYVDRHGVPHPMPEVAIERDSRLAFARLLRELDLDASAPAQTLRPPRLPSSRRY
jgi:phage terminase small subunit